jgi:hypothetical protein
LDDAIAPPEVVADNASAAMPSLTVSAPAKIATPDGPSVFSGDSVTVSVPADDIADPGPTLIDTDGGSVPVDAAALAPLRIA